MLLQDMFNKYVVSDQSENTSPFTKLYTNNKKAKNQKVKRKMESYNRVYISKLALPHNSVGSLLFALANTINCHSNYNKELGSFLRNSQFFYFCFSLFRRDKTHTLGNFHHFSILFLIDHNV